jgi:hypothetical protein
VELPVLQVHGTAVVRLSGKGGFLPPTTSTMIKKHSSLHADQETNPNLVIPTEAGP